MPPVNERSAAQSGIFCAFRRGVGWRRLWRKMSCVWWGRVSQEVGVVGVGQFKLLQCPPSFNTPTTSLCNRASSLPAGAHLRTQLLALDLLMDLRTTSEFQKSPCHWPSPETTRTRSLKCRNYTPLSLRELYIPRTHSGVDARSKVSTHRSEQGFFFQLSADSSAFKLGVTDDHWTASSTRWSTSCCSSCCSTQEDGSVLEKQGFPMPIGNVL